MRVHACLALLGALSLSGAVMANPVVFSQSWNGSASGFSSQNELGSGGRGDFSKSYDNFRLGATTRITDIHWTGAWFNQTVHGTQTSALLEIWADNGSNRPGSLLFTETVTGTANETLLSGQTYAYNADLTVDFLAQAGVTYWLSIQSVTTRGPQWGWSQALTADSRSVQRFFSSTNVNAADLAFQLDGVVDGSVDEPGTLLLAALALGTLVGDLRKRDGVRRA